MRAQSECCSHCFLQRPAVCSWRARHSCLMKITGKGETHTSRGENACTWMSGAPAFAASSSLKYVSPAQHNATQRSASICAAPSHHSTTYSLPCRTAGADEDKWLQSWTLPTQLMLWYTPVKSGWIPPCMQVSEAPRDQASWVLREISEYGRRYGLPRKSSAMRPLLKAQKPQAYVHLLV